MRTSTVIVLMVGTGVLGGVVGAVITSKVAGTSSTAKSHHGVRVSTSDSPVAEGPIWSAAYDSADDPGNIAGFTAVDNPKAVPGGNGSWNDRRYGKLYREFLVVTKPSEKNWGVQVIPVHRIRSIHFLKE